MHRLADEPGKASREGRATEPRMTTQRAKGPRVLGVFVDQLQRLADVAIRNCTEPPPFAGTKGFDPTAQHFDKEHLGHPRQHSELAGTLASKSPAVMRLGRDAFYAVWDMAAEDALAHLHAMLTLTTQTEDAAEGISAFLEKRPPRWTGR